MRFMTSIVLMALVFPGFTSSAGSSPLTAEVAIDASDGVPGNQPTCATREVGSDEQIAVQKQVEKWISENPQTLALGGNIKIAWHVIYDGATGNIPQSMIDATIAVLNAAYAGVPGGAATGYTFSLASVDRTNKRQWFTMEMGSAEEQQAKKVLGVDVRHRLNIYSCRPPSGANWGTFPWAFAENNKTHGVVLHINYLPGSVWSFLYTGDVAVHEVGHYLGLYHTHQGGCTPPGDEVADTPDMVWGGTWPSCDSLWDSCPSAGIDPIHNYMAYSADSCKTEFTTGQDDRMDLMVAAYRPNLLNAAREPTGPIVGLESRARSGDMEPVRGVKLLGATPDPSSGTIDIRFAIPASGDVELRLYDLTGRAVSAAAHGSYAAGSHDVSWPSTDDAGRRLAPGVYFLRVTAGDVSATQRIVLVR